MTERVRVTCPHCGSKVALGPRRAITTHRDPAEPGRRRGCAASGKEFEQACQDEEIQG